jgi:1-deoxy-D-xylulose-5-phosphate synthase
MQAIPVGTGEVRRRGHRVALLAFGSMLAPCLEAGEVLDATVVNMRFVKPIDAALIGRLAAEHEFLVTVEENVVMGGAGSAVAEVLAGQGLRPQLLLLGLPDRFIEHGDPKELLRAAGLDATGIARSVQQQANAGVARARSIVYERSGGN